MCGPFSHLHSQKRRHMEPKYHFSWIHMIFHTILTLMHFSLGWSTKSILTKLIALVAVQSSPSPSPDTPVWASKYRREGGCVCACLNYNCCPHLFFSSLFLKNRHLLLFKPSPPTCKLTSFLSISPFYMNCTFSVNLYLASGTSLLPSKLFISP